MKLEVRDAGDNVVSTLDFEIDPYQERRITINSSTGGASHIFSDSSPLIYIRVPTYNMTVDGSGGEEETPAITEASTEPEPEPDSVFSS